MEVELFVPPQTDVSVIRQQYPDLCDVELWFDDGLQLYWIGHSMDDDELDFEWFSYEEAVEFCGFCEGAIEGAQCLIEGNGGWAQGMISRRDFSQLAMTKQEKRLRKETSDRYWAAFEHGKKAN